MNIYLIYGDTDVPLAKRLGERLAAAKHMVVETLDESNVTLGVLSPDAVASPDLISGWEKALRSERPLLFVLAAPCSVPPRFARISFIDFTPSNEDAGWGRLQGVLDALAKPVRDMNKATMELRKVEVSVAGNVSGSLNVAGGDIVIDRREIYLGGAPTEDQRIDRRNRELLLQKMRSFWVEGVLEKSLHGLAEIEIGKKDKPRAVDHPWGMLLETVVGGSTKTLPLGTKTVNLFDEAGHALLILGGPGSGKTTVLLELARDSIARAENDPDQPIPIVLNLASWSNTRQPLAEWMINDLTLKYQVPRKIGEPWLKSGDLLPLLDGLDEVSEDRRDDCILAINTFREEYGLVPIAVCCRTEEYEATKVKLKLGGAVVIMPLTPKQVDRYLEGHGEELAGLRATLAQDEELMSIAQTPLMLGVMVMAYRGASTETLTNLTTCEDRRKHLFDTYVQRMLKRRADPIYTPDKTIKYLIWLAQRMKAQNYSTFMVERLKPEWFPNSSERSLFRWLAIAVGALLGGLSFFVFTVIHDAIVGLPMQPDGTIIGAITGGWIMAQGYRKDAWRLGGEAAVTLGIVAAIIIAVKYPFMVPEMSPFQAGLSAAEQRDLWLIFILGMVAGALENGPLAGLVIWQAGARAGKPVEALLWSWKGALKGFLVGLAVVGVTFFLAQMILFLFGDASATVVSLTQIINWLGFALVLSVMPGLVPAFIFGLSGRETGTVASPMESIRLSARNGVLVGVGTASLIILGAVVLSVIQSITEALPFLGVLREFLIEAGALAIPAMIFTGLLFGGIILIKHHLMRILLASRDYLPRDIVPFLNHAESLIFLRRVGAGYIFIHRLVLDHFCSLGGVQIIPEVKLVQTGEYPAAVEING